MHDDELIDAEAHADDLAVEGALRLRIGEPHGRAHKPAQEFVAAKLKERDERHQKLGDSRYRLEPNVKEDKGGLRDLHTLGWIAKYLYGVADVREPLFTGFFEGNQQLRVNGLRWGLDNWVHVASGGHHGKYGVNTKLTSALTGQQILVGSRDFRFRPDTRIMADFIRTRADGWSISPWLKRRIRRSNPR